MDTTPAHGADHAKIASLRSHVLNISLIGRCLVADAHRGDGKRFAVLADKLLNAFVELEWPIRGR